MDQAWAEWISLVLEQAGYRVVVQAWDFGSGNFLEQMERAVRRARRLLPVLSEAYLEGKYGLTEWTAFAKDLSTIIPVKIEDIETRSILGTLVRVNLLGLAERDAAEHLRSGIQELVDPPPHAPQRRREARFPGTVAQIARDADDRASATDPTVRRITPDPGRVQLVILGSGEPARTAVAKLPALLDVAAERTHDLYDSELAAADQLTEVAAVLNGLRRTHTVSPARWWSTEYCPLSKLTIGVLRPTVRLTGERGGEQTADAAVLAPRRASASARKTHPVSPGPLAGDQRTPISSPSSAPPPRSRPACSSNDPSNNTPQLRDLHPQVFTIALTNPRARPEPDTQTSTPPPLTTTAVARP